MIPVTKSLRPIPTSLSSQECNENINRIYNNGIPNKKLIVADYYRAEDVVERLRRMYHEKCAYCETKDPGFEIEHYRPKKRVALQDLNGQSHPGYYWLVNEWTNLIPACHDCNKNGVKGNRFPVNGNRLNAPILDNGLIDRNDLNFNSVSLTNEVPLLLHPENPEFDSFQYFRFTEKGFIKEKDRYGTLKYLKAKNTIEVVDLNRKKLRLYRRKSEINKLHRQVKFLFFNYIREKIEVNEIFALANLERGYFELLRFIKSNISPTKEYSFFWNYIYRNVDLILRVPLKPKYRTVFIELTRKFKER